jgi:hypothetical protein
MLRERTLAASRSRRATCAATRGVIFTVSFVRVLSGSARRRAALRLSGKPTIHHHDSDADH